MHPGPALHAVLYQQLSIFILFSWIAERQTERKRGLLSLTSLPQYSHGYGWAGLEPGARNTLQVSHVGGRNCCLPGAALAGSWNWEPELGIEHKHSDVALGLLTMRPNTDPGYLLLTPLRGGHEGSLAP